MLSLVGLVVATLAVLMIRRIGFTSTGIVAGSKAPVTMAGCSGGVASRSLVAILQSIGATGVLGLVRKFLAHRVGAIIIIALVCGPRVGVVIALAVVFGPRVGSLTAVVAQRLLAATSSAS